MSSTGKATKRMPREEWDRLEEIIERFEEAWRGGQRPVIDDYLKAEQIAPQQLLLELVHAELECRLKAGEEVRVETYFERYPQIAHNVEGVLELIAAEYGFRQRREPNLKPEDFLQRFPQYRAQLPAHLLPFLQDKDDSAQQKKFGKGTKKGAGGPGGDYRNFSPDKKQYAFVKNHNLYVAEAETPAGQHFRQRDSFNVGAH